MLCCNCVRSCKAMMKTTNIGLNICRSAKQIGMIKSVSAAEKSQSLRHSRDFPTVKRPIILSQFPHHANLKISPSTFSSSSSPTSSPSLRSPLTLTFAYSFPRQGLSKIGRKDGAKAEKEDERNAKILEQFFPSVFR